VAPLLPKLRGHFAEFLRESYLAPFSILNHPTCVGFGYGSFIVNVVRAFLGSLTSHTSKTYLLVLAPQLKTFSPSLIASNT
jgi:hypothetical protein